MGTIYKFGFDRPDDKVVSVTIRKRTKRKFPISISILDDEDRIVGLNLTEKEFVHFCNNFNGLYNKVAEY